MRVQVPVYSPPSPPPSLYPLPLISLAFAGVVYRRGSPLRSSVLHLPAPLFILPFSPLLLPCFIFIISFFSILLSPFVSKSPATRSSPSRRRCSRENPLAYAWGRAECGWKSNRGSSAARTPPVAYVGAPISPFARTMVNLNYKRVFLAEMPHKLPSRRCDEAARPGPAILLSLAQQIRKMRRRR